MIVSLEQQLECSIKLLKLGVSPLELAKIAALDIDAETLYSILCPGCEQIHCDCDREEASPQQLLGDGTRWPL